MALVFILNQNLIMKKITLICALAIFIAGCGKKELTREKAFEFIKETKTYPRVFDYDIFAFDPEHARKVYDTSLEKDGYVVVKKSWSMLNEDPLMAFTEKAKPFLLPKGKEAHIQPVKIADEELGEVTGIRTSSSGKQAIAEYTTTYKNVSPFSVLVKTDLSKSNTRKRYFAMYDDGWRIVEKPGMEFLELETP